MFDKLTSQQKQTETSHNVPTAWLLIDTCSRCVGSRRKPSVPI